MILKVAIVIVTWNKKSDVLNLLGALKSLNYDNFDIIVVDNASTDRSADEVASVYPDVTLIINTENLGGAGGFKTGMNYALQKAAYRYIWLLDNDAMVENDTLLQLVTVAERDERIGIAGSLILNPDKPGMIVELGAFVAWDLGTWKPHLRSASISIVPQDAVVEVDYVPACSALIRTDALKKSGVMDARFFLHWDDIDLCLRIKEAGYKVVAVSRSRVYHGVEKGFNPVLAYYDIRNGLLAISMHTRYVKKVMYVLNMLRGTIKGIVYSYVVRLRGIGFLLVKSVHDFVRGRFYKINLTRKLKFVFEGGGPPLPLTDVLQGALPRILILPNGNAGEIASLVTTVKDHQKEARITLLIQADRKNLFDGLGIDEFIIFDSYRQSILHTISVMARILSSRYDCVISPSMSPLPFSYAARKYFLFDVKAGSFYENKENLSRAWKLPLIVLSAELLSLILFPPVYWASIKHRKPDSSLNG